MLNLVHQVEHAEMVITMGMADPQHQITIEKCDAMVHDLLPRALPAIKQNVALRLRQQYPRDISVLPWLHRPCTEEGKPTSITRDRFRQLLNLLQEILR
jgi:hypothetical protein